jgi:hypothetical protein
MFVLFVKMDRIYRLVGRYASWQEALEAAPDGCNWQIMPESEWQKCTAVTGKGK